MLGLLMKNNYIFSFCKNRAEMEEKKITNEMAYLFIAMYHS